MRIFVASGWMALLLLWGGAAEAKPAICETSEDGRYPCEFTFTDGQGSFEITTPDNLTVRLEIERPGVAVGFKVFERGGREVFLPGHYIRDRECWVNDETADRICAY